MREIRENNIITGYELNKDIEVETLRLAINTFINGVIVENEQSLKVRSIQFLQGYIMAEELISDLDKGVRVLASDSDYYLSETSLRYFNNYFIYCADRNIMRTGAKDIGITEDRFVINAISSYSMLKILPNMTESTKK